MHLIGKGRFAIRVMTRLGDMSTIAIRGPGENFGEMALVVENGRRSATVQALEPAETLCVYQADFQRLRKQHPSVGDVLTAFLVGEIRLLNERLLEALYIPAERRVLRRLAELAETYGATDGAGQIPLTQEELASLAGTSRATVNRVLGEEAERGTIERKRGKIVGLDQASIAKRAR